jgi:RND family efflux transporter MFP subunit
MSESAPTFAGRKLTKRHFVWACLIAALIVSIAFLVNGPLASFFATSTSANEEMADSVKPLPVNVGEIEFVESIMQSRSYTGTVRARHRSDLGFELSGKIKSISVDEGDAVTAGQVLAELDTDTLDAQKGAVLARLAQANSLMDELNAGPRVETIKAARATMTAAKSQFDNAALNLQRRKRLYEGGAISAEENDRAVFAEETARANLSAAQEQLSELEAGTRLEQVEGQKSAVRQLEASAREIDVAIEKSKLLAPFDGTVTRRYLDPGSIAQASVPVIRLIEQKHLEAWIGLPVSIIAELEIGSKHDILIDGRTFVGTASAKIRELDPATRTQTVLFVLPPSASDKVVSGQLCEIQVTSSINTSGFWIPTSALTKGVRGLWSVMVITPEESGTRFRARKRDIDIINTDSNRVLAKGTIEDGDRIIINGVHRVAEGQLVIPSD